MANALPQAIGAQITYPERQVISISGDGGLAMLMGDLLTLKQHELPVKTIVLRNDSLAFVELEMKASLCRFWNRSAQSGVRNDRGRSRNSRIESGDAGTGRTDDCASSQT